MNINKFQREMFDRLTRGERVVYSEDNGMILLADGFVGYAFYEKEILLDLKKCYKHDALTDLLKLDENDTRLEETNELYSCGGRLCVAFKTERGAKIWIQKKFITNLKDCYFYGHNPTDRIIACDMRKRPIAVILPMRISALEVNHED